MAAVAVLVAMAQPAAAHAALIGSQPADGVNLDQAPSLVVLTFSEPVTVPPGAIRVYDGQLDRVDLPVAPSDEASREIVVPLRQDLGDDGYAIVWRVVSADSHPVAGVIRFAVGDGSMVADDLVGELARDAGGSVANILGSLTRATISMALLVAFGAVAATGFGVARKLAARVAQRAAMVAIAASVLAVGFQAAAVTGQGWQALQTDIVASVMASSFGQSTWLRVIWLVALMVMVRWRAPMPIAVLAAAVAAGSLALDGHQRIGDPVWLLTSVDVVHILAAGVWVGGLVTVAAILGRDRARIDATVANGVSLFSTVALTSVGLVAVSGGVMARILVGSPAGMTSPYGWTLVAKVAVVVIVVGIAAWNRWKLVPGLRTLVDAGEDGSGGADPTVPRQMAILMRYEVALLAVVLVITGFLVATPPPADSDESRWFATTVVVDGIAELDVVVEPARVGLNTVHVYALDAAGMPTDTIDDVAFEFTYVPEAIGPLRVEPYFAGTGHWIANTDIFAFRGTWQLELIVGVDRFTESRYLITFDVR